jgi:hypothetical protein
MVVRLSPAPHLRNWHGARCGLVLERIPDSDVVADQRRVLVVGAPRAISNNGPAMCTDPLHRRFVCDTVDPARMADAGKRQGPINPKFRRARRNCHRPGKAVARSFGLPDQTFKLIQINARRG